MSMDLRSGVHHSAHQRRRPRGAPRNLDDGRLDHELAKAPPAPAERESLQSDRQS
jgi:hypothetical protein